MPKRARLILFSETSVFYLLSLDYFRYLFDFYFLLNKKPYSSVFPYPFVWTLQKVALFFILNIMRTNIQVLNVNITIPSLHIFDTNNSSFPQHKNSKKFPISTTKIFHFVPIPTLLENFKKNVYFHTKIFRFCRCVFLPFLVANQHITMDKKINNTNYIEFSPIFIGCYFGRCQYSQNQEL